MNVRAHLSEAGWLALIAAVLLWSWIGAYDPGVWVMEVLPVFIAVPVLAVTRKGFPLTSLVYTLILVHAIILMVGGHYTYARVPLGFWLQECSTSAATTTTASAIWRRASSRPWWRAKSCCVRPR